MEDDMVSIYHSAEIIVKAKKLTKVYDTLKAVDGIDFEITRGECFGFLGPNGAGKTTTMRMIYGFTPKTSGDLTVFGLPVDKYSRIIRSRLGISPQEDNLDPDFTALENLLVYARYFGIKRSVALRKAEELLQFFDIEHKSNQIIRTLSGGMKKRLLLARSLINNPEMLILDEPTTGLDPQARHAIWDKIIEMKNKGVTIILTSHYMEEAERLCDRIVIMDHGKILTKGNPRELIKQYIGEEVIEISPINGFKEIIVSRFPNTEIEHIGNRLEVFIKKKDSEIARFVMTELNPEFVYLRRATLEDVFFKLTGRQLRD